MVFEIRSAEARDGLRRGGLIRARASIYNVDAIAKVRGLFCSGLAT